MFTGISIHHASAVAEHVFTVGHQVDLSKASVIDYHPHTQTWCLLESWHIQHQQAPLNRERGPNARALCNPSRLIYVTAHLLLVLFHFRLLF